LINGFFSDKKTNERTKDLVGFNCFSIKVSREAKIEDDWSLRSQIRDFIIFSKDLLDHEIDDSLAFMFQCSKTTVIRAKNEDLSLKKPTMGAPTIFY